MATILQIAKDAAVELSLDSFVQMGNAATLFPAFDDGDSAPSKILRAMTRACKEIAADYPWKDLRCEQVIAALPRELQPDAIPPDFLEYIPGTFQDRTRGWPMNGPLSQGEWAAIKARPIGLSFMSWMEDAGGLRLYPIPENGRIFSYRYRSNAIGWDKDRDPNPGWANGPAGDAPTWGNGPPDAGQARKRITRFTADTNAPLWDDELITLGTVVHYLRIEREPDELAEQAFDVMLFNRQKQDGGRRTIDFGRDRNSASTDVEALKRSAVVVRVAT